jgi:hypothetical protein
MEPRFPAGSPISCFDFLGTAPPRTVQERGRPNSNVPAQRNGRLLLAEVVKNPLLLPVEPAGED